MSAWVLMVLDSFDNWNMLMSLFASIGIVGFFLVDNICRYQDVIRDLFLDGVLDMFLMFTTAWTTFVDIRIWLVRYQDMTCFLIVCQFGMFLGLSDMYFEQLGMLSLTLLLYMSAKFIVCLFVARSQHMYCLWQVQMYRIFISYCRIYYKLI